MENTQPNEAQATPVQAELGDVAVSGIIDSVPGVERAPELPAPVTEAPLGSRQNPNIADHDFKGDPRRVIGHPSNPNNAVMQALSDHLRK